MPLAAGAAIACSLRSKAARLASLASRSATSSCHGGVPGGNVGRYALHGLTFGRPSAGGAGPTGSGSSPGAAMPTPPTEPRGAGRGPLDACRDIASHWARHPRYNRSTHLSVNEPQLVHTDRGPLLCETHLIGPLWETTSERTLILGECLFCPHHSILDDTHTALTLSSRSEQMYRARNAEVSVCKADTRRARI